MKKKIRLGIIGGGWPGQQHAKAVLANDSRAELYACAEPDEARSAEFKSSFAPRRMFSDYHQLLADPEVDAVIVCLPNYLHFPASLAALQSGRHVLCEKPPTLNAAEMFVLRDMARERKLIYFFGRQFRFSPAMTTARELVAEGRLGTIYFAKAVWIRSRGTPVGIGGWFTDKKRSGGGALIDIGVHALDAAWFLMGAPRPVSVSAQVYRHFEHIVTAPVFDVEDSAYAFIRFENGAVVHLEASWAANLPDDIPFSSWTGREFVNTTLYGTKATIRLNPLTLFEDREGTVMTIPLEPESEVDAFELQMRNFLEAIAGEAAAINDAAQAYRLMEMLDAIYASSEQGREVAIS